MLELILKSLFVIFNIWYWTGEGATEGFTWATEKRRLENLIIKPGIHDSTFYKTASGLMCYHSWRTMGENVGIFGMNIVSFSLGVLAVSWPSYIGIFVGATLVGIFIYERVFNHVSYNKLFPQKASWDAFNGRIVIPRAPWQDWVLFGIGIVLLVIYF